MVEIPDYSKVQKHQIQKSFNVEGHSDIVDWVKLIEYLFVIVDKNVDKNVDTENEVLLTHIYGIRLR